MLSVTRDDTVETERRRALRQAVDRRRRTLGFSYKELAELSETSISTVNRLINQEDYWPRPLQIRSILRVLGFDPDSDAPVIVDGIVQIPVDSALDDLSASEQLEAIRTARKELLDTASRLRTQRGGGRDPFRAPLDPVFA